MLKPTHHKSIWHLARNTKDVCRKLRAGRQKKLEDGETWWRWRGRFIHSHIYTKHSKWVITSIYSEKTACNVWSIAYFKEYQFICCFLLQESPWFNVWIHIIPMLRTISIIFTKQLPQSFGTSMLITTKLTYPWWFLQTFLEDNLSKLCKLQALKLINCTSLDAA